MNIMIFCSNPVNGGTARMFYESVRGLKEHFSADDRLYPCINKGNDVEIYYKIEGLIKLPVVSAETMFPELYGGSLPLRILKNLKRSIRYGRVKRENIEAICDFIREKSIDTMIIHNGGYVGDDLCNQALDAAYRCRNIAKSRIYVLHNDMKKGFLAKLRFRGYDKKVSKESTSIITVSNYTKNRIERSSFISRDIQVIYDGIDVVKLLTREQKDKIIRTEPDKHNILMIGNFLENKGQKQFIECADALYKKDNDYRFTIIGNVYDKEYHKECMDLMMEKGLGGVVSIYHGINNASEFIELFDVQVVPSMYDESFGLISVEAMANGVPVVAFACGGIPEVVENGRDGFVVSVGDTKQMSDQIDWLITHDEERIKMSKVCKEDYRRKFSTKAMIGQYVKLISNGSLPVEWKS